MPGLRKSRLLYSSLRVLTRNYSSKVSSNEQKSFSVLVLGGGAGGCATTARFAAKLGRGKVAVIEPALTHYYQPMWTLVGGGMKTLEDSGRPMKQVLPSKATWFQEKVASFNPEKNTVTTDRGNEIHYEYLVVALGLQLNYGAIKGLEDALETKGVCSNYSPLHVNKTFQALKDFEEGNAIFTHPATSIKCAGAPQKILYISEEYFRKNNRRSKANVIFNSAGPAIFGVKTYADALWKVVESRNISVNLRHNLVEVKADSREAVFDLLDEPGKTVTYPYEMLHVTPPMSSLDVVRSSALADASGYVDVHKETLQHIKYKNIFGIGDCTNLPCSKTAAAAAAQFAILQRNLSRVMAGKEPNAAYDGYASCPLVTGYSKCILAEFDYDLQPLETFPFNQAKERRTMFHMKKDLMPTLYWKGMLSGYWEGPKMMRKLLHLGFSK